MLTTAMGIGSVTGALASGARGWVSPRLLTGAAALFGVAQLIAAAAPTLGVQVLALIPLGAASVTFSAGVNSTLQLAAGPGLRGRIMALYSVVFIGSTPIGAPLVGWLAEVAGPRAGLTLGGAAALAAAAGGAVAFARRSRASSAATGGPSRAAAPAARPSPVVDGAAPHAPAARPVEQVAGR
jgi:MFS family permease